jgi:hypothetical protein
MTVKIEPSRLILRPIELGDFDDLVALVWHPEVTRFVPSLDRGGAEDAIRGSRRGSCGRSCAPSGALSEKDDKNVVLLSTRVGDP